jgi:hypothetical protein
MTPQTLEVLADILGQVQISVSHPDFAAVAQRLASAKAEVSEALASASD